VPDYTTARIKTEKSKERLQVIATPAKLEMKAVILLEFITIKKTSGF
jgi:hypothetical protein